MEAEGIPRDAKIFHSQAIWFLLLVMCSFHCFVELESWTCSKLKQALRERGCTVSGRKAQLVARLLEYNRNVGILPAIQHQSTAQVPRKRKQRAGRNLFSGLNILVRVGGTITRRVRTIFGGRILEFGGNVLVKKEDLLNDPNNTVVVCDQAAQIENWPEAACVTNVSRAWLEEVCNADAGSSACVHTRGQGLSVRKLVEL